MASIDINQWRRERGSSRGYVNTVTGQRLSRRQFDKLKGGPKPDTNSTRVYQSKKYTRHYNQLVKDRVNYLKERGEKVDYNKVKKSQEMRDLNKRYRWTKSEKALWHKYLRLEGGDESIELTDKQFAKIKQLSLRRRDAMVEMGEVPKDGDPYVYIGF